MFGKSWLETVFFFLDTGQARVGTDGIVGQAGHNGNKFFKEEIVPISRN